MPSLLFQRHREAWCSERPLRCRFVTEPTTQRPPAKPQTRTFAELLIDCEGPDAPVVLVEMLRERQQVTARTSLRTGRRLASISYEK